MTGDRGAEQAQNPKSQINKDRNRETENHIERATREKKTQIPRDKREIGGYSAETLEQQDHPIARSSGQCTVVERANQRISKRDPSVPRSKADQSPRHEEPNKTQI